jgi:antitoxin VapB
MSELDEKLSRMRDLLAERDLDALLLRRVSSFAWATGGAASYVNTAAGEGAASLLVTRDRRTVITTNIEAPRLEREEGLADEGWEFHVVPWHAGGDPVAGLAGGMKLGADVPYPGAADTAAEVSAMRANLLPAEIERVRDLGERCAAAMDAAIRAVRPGQAEYEIAGRLAEEAQSRGAQAIVNLIASDERVFSFRHPLPTNKRMERYAMLVLCGRRRGLVCSITRLVHFGRLGDELRRKALATAHVDATFIAATRPGRTLGEIFARAQAAYAASGFGEEWGLHHQGGPAGYEPRETIATPGSTYPVAPGQIYAWNPSITGTKSEDTILVGPDGNQILTAIPGWPALEVPVEGQAEPVLRPDILVVT